MQNAYSILISKLRAFTQKYYQNLLLRGLIVSFSMLAIAFILFALIEYYGQFGTLTRSILFWSFTSLSSCILIVWILIPILKLIKLSKRLSDEGAAKIIGKHFPDVADKLLNVIQLKQQSTGNLDLLEASINQKSLDLKPIPFVSAINFLENKRYLKYALIPIFIFGGLILADSEEIITASSARIIDYKTEYIPPAPFEFSIENKNLECIQHQDYKIIIKLLGAEIPTNTYLELNGLPIKMKKMANHQFEYTFTNIQKSKDFKFNAGGLYSKSYKLNVLAAPSLVNFKLSLDYPYYTHKKDEILENIGEVLIPEGTKATWEFSTENTENFAILWDSTKLESIQEKEGTFSFSKTAKKTTNYTLLPSNEYVNTLDSVTYLFKVLKDGYPIVDASEVVDSTVLKTRYFKGEIKDDYGFTKLQFVIKKTNNNWDSIVPLEFNKDLNLDNFFFVFDMSTMKLKGDDALEYYFEVYDNDGINGAKKSQSRNFEFKAPSKEEIQKQQAEKTDEPKKSLEENVELAKELQEEFEELRRKLLDKWE